MFKGPKRTYLPSKNVLASSKRDIEPVLKIINFYNIAEELIHFHKCQMYILITEFYLPSMIHSRDIKVTLATLNTLAKS